MTADIPTRLGDSSDWLRLATTSTPLHSMHGCILHYASQKRATAVAALAARPGPARSAHYWPSHFALMLRWLDGKTKKKKDGEQEGALRKTPPVGV